MIATLQIVHQQTNKEPSYHVIVDCMTMRDTHSNNIAIQFYSCSCTSASQLFSISSRLGQLFLNILVFRAISSVSGVGPSILGFNCYCSG